MEYDVIIIGAGVAGGLIADRLASHGKRVLMLECGNYNAARSTLVSNYLTAPVQSLGSPYNDPSGTMQNMAPGPESSNGKYNDYYDQDGEPADVGQFKSTYERRVGGSTWHWLGNCPRLIPSDFNTKTLFGFGKDWPISYTDLEPWYCEAEHELGVAGDHEALNGMFGATRSRPFPMNRIWPSYSDLRIADRLKDSRHIGSEYNDLPLEIVSTPQARNSQPYDGRPVCTGNSTCVPICPIGAKYDAMVHINKAKDKGASLLDRCIVTNLSAGRNGKITDVTYRTWEGVQKQVTASIYVLAANAIETPKLLLMSGIANRSDQVGRNLMDHPQSEGICVVPEPVFPFRGPPTTSGIDKFRDGDFRKDMPAFRISLGNDGSGRSRSPVSILGKLANETFGTALRQRLRDDITHRFRFSVLAEMLPSADNRVLLSAQRDATGIPRPKIHFKVDDYTINGYAKIGELMRSIFTAIGCAPEMIEVPGRYVYLPAGHIMGTCRMGDDPGDSVVDAECRAHDHDNLFIAGASVFPTVGTANPTLTVAALSLRIAETIIRQLG